MCVFFPEIIFDPDKNLKFFSKNFFKSVVINNMSKHPNELVMYLFVNDDLKMSKGKVAGQVGHCVGMLVESVFRKNDKNLLNKYKQWSAQGMKKVILKCKEKELANLMKNHECEYVLDEGLTEVKSGSLTVVGVLPTCERFFEFKLL